MKKVYHLSTCKTCQRVLSEVKPGRDFIIQNVKDQPVTARDLDRIKDMAGSYDALFSRKSRKYREWKLHEKELTESDKRDLMLREYTFLKRPIFVIEGSIYIGHSGDTIQAIMNSLK